MKKNFLVLIGAVSIIFILSLFFLKPTVNKFFLKETEVTYIEGEKEKVTLNTGDFVVFGKYLDENILWKVVDVQNEKPLLQTNYVVSFKCFDPAHGDNSDIGKLGKAQWETSALKKWLNAKGKVEYGEVRPDDKSVFNGKNSYENELGFLSEFSDKEVSMLTKDGVFILSKNAIEKMSQKDRVKTATKSAIMQDESRYIILSGRNIWYWTSTATGVNRTSVTTVTSGGGFYKASAYDGVTGVVPAAYLNSKSVISVSGDGSEEKPYIIKQEG